VAAAPIATAIRPLPEARRERLRRFPKEPFIAGGSGGWSFLRVAAKSETAFVVLRPDGGHFKEAGRRGFQWGGARRAFVDSIDSDMPFDPLYIFLGACVGVVVGMTGIGGGSLMTPALVPLFGVHPVTAVGTDLLYAATTKCAGSVVHALKENVAWRVVALLATGSVPVAVGSLLIVSHLGSQSELMAKVITTVLGVALLFTAVLLVFRRWLVALRRRRPAPNARRDVLLTVLTGAVVGLLVSISSVGAGAIGVTALLLLYPAYSTVRIVGTDIAHAVPLTLIAGTGHWLAGSVDAPMLLSLLAGSIPGIVLGSYLAPRVPEHGLRFALACILVVVGAKLVVS
jgi:hypothetical protein